jgi:hypothetical protein
MTIITSDTKKYVTYVVLAIGIFVLFFVTSLFHFYDTSDLSFYASACYYLLHGVLPYYRFIFPYPPLALLPMLLAYPSFPVIFAFEMLICQFIILFCVYEITLHIKPESAFLPLLYSRCFLLILHSLLFLPLKCLSASLSFCFAFMKLLYISNPNPPFSLL